jgi:hypothetical protein
MLAKRTKQAASEGFGCSSACCPLALPADYFICSCPVSLKK